MEKEKIALVAGGAVVGAALTWIAVDKYREHKEKNTEVFKYRPWWKELLSLNRKQATYIALGAAIGVTLGFLSVDFIRAAGSNPLLENPAVYVSMKMCLTGMGGILGAIMGGASTIPTEYRRSPTNGESGPV